MAKQPPQPPKPPRPPTGPTPTQSVPGPGTPPGGGGGRTPPPTVGPPLDARDWRGGGGGKLAELGGNESTRDKDLAAQQKEADKALKERAKAEREAEKAMRRNVAAIDDLSSHFGKVGKAFGSALSALHNAAGDGKGGLAGGLGGLTGILGKAGPYAAVASGVLDLAKVPFDLIKAGFDGLEHAVQGAGKTVRHLASNDGIGALSEATDLAADALGAIPVVGGAAASALKLFGTSLNVFKGVIDGLAARGRELAPLNATLAQTVAEVDIQKFFADLNEANRNEAEYRDLIIAQSRLDREWQSAITELKKELIPLATQGAKALTLVAKLIPVLIKSMSGFSGLLPGVKETFDGIADMVDLLGKIDDNTKKDKPADADGLGAIMDFANFGANVPQNPLPRIGGAVPPLLGGRVKV